MGHTLKRAGVPKGEKNKPYYTTIGHWAAIITMANWKSKSPITGTEIRTGHDVWEAKNVGQLATVLESITKKNYHAYQKLRRDEVLKNPIVMCGDCEGEGITIYDWKGQPQYPNFCSSCKGLGVTRDTYNSAENVSLDDLAQAIRFLRGTDEYPKGSGVISVS